MPSWKKILQSGSAAHVLNITASNLPNIFKNHVLMYNTASGVITYFSSSLEPPLETAPVQQAGTLIYDNAALTPMTNTTVRLIDSSGNLLTSDTTGTTNGNFNFGQVPVGNYYVQFQTNKPWGGITATDTLNITRHFSNNQLLTGIRKLAADVNGDNVIDAVDIYLIGQAFQVGPANVSGYKGEWVFGSGSGPNFRGWYGINAINASNPVISNGTISPSNGAVSSIGIPLTASVNNTNLQYLALCLGDADGSNIPNVNL